jgi:hypothetical protein
LVVTFGIGGVAQGPDTTGKQSTILQEEPIQIAAMDGEETGKICAQFLYAVRAVEITDNVIYPTDVAALPTMHTTENTITVLLPVRLLSTVHHASVPERKMLHVGHAGLTSALHSWPIKNLLMQRNVSSGALGKTTGVGLATAQAVRLLLIGARAHQDSRKALNASLLPIIPLFFQRTSS